MMSFIYCFLGVKHISGLVGIIGRNQNCKSRAKWLGVFSLINRLKTTRAHSPSSTAVASLYL